MFGRTKKVQINQDVARTAKLLDECAPGWHNHINLATLNMHSMSKCVFGQLGKNYPAMHEVDEKHFWGDYPFGAAVKYVKMQTGFDVTIHNSLLHWGGLQSWTAAIKVRREADAQAVRDEAKRAEYEAKCRAKAKRHLRIVPVPVEAQPEYELVA